MRLMHFQSIQSIESKMTKQDNKKCCNLCSKSILGGNLARHMQTHNAEKSSFDCTICGKSFEKNHHLKIHMFLHNREKNFKCKECNYSSSQATNLKDHMTSTHADLDHQKRCNSCNYSGYSKQDLQHHMTKVHNKKPQGVKMEEDVYSGINYLFEEDIKVDEDIKKEVEDINMKLKVEVEDVKIGEVEMEDLKEALLEENSIEGEVLEAISAPEPSRDLLDEKVGHTNETTAEETSKDPAEICNMSMPCQREELDFCQETFDFCFLRAVALAENNQRREKKKKLCLWV